ncbi:MAG: cytochrome c-type biogenesis protein CcmH, partial [Candidatus Firestonebacteria bacterium]|nr:cytochrome c-type biogenesis protein CcmH [Candidatus Firestonebacteria bacterium]
TMEEIHSEIKCPDHDRPEIVSLVDKLIKEGKTKEEILDDVGNKFGIGVLVNPSEKKIGVVPFLVPSLVLALSIIIAFAYIGKWIKINKSKEKDSNIDKNNNKQLNDEKYENQFEKEYKAFKEKS